MTAQTSFHLPVHPTMRDPRTGEPLQALGVIGGRVVWPIMGASPDDSSNQGGQGGDGGTGGTGAGGAGGAAGQGGTGSGSGTGGDSGRSNATDGQGNDLGYPKDTPVTEMSDKEQAAYWKHNSRRHESRYKDILGDRRPEDVKKDLDSYAELQRQQQTPAEQAINDAREEGRKAAIEESNSKAATAILRASLTLQGVESGDVDDIVDALDVRKFVTDDGDLDTDKLSSFAKRFTPAGTADDRRHRDFGGGRRRDSQDRERGAGGKAEAARRFQKNKQTTDA